MDSTVAVRRASFRLLTVAALVNLATLGSSCMRPKYERTVGGPLLLEPELHDYDTEVFRDPRIDAYENGVWGYPDRMCEQQSGIDDLEGLNARELQIGERSGSVERAAIHGTTPHIVNIEESRDDEKARHRQRFGTSFPMLRCQGWTQKAAGDRWRVAARGDP